MIMTEKQHNNSCVLNKKKEKNFSKEKIYKKIMLLKKSFRILTKKQEKLRKKRLRPLWLNNKNLVKFSINKKNGNKKRN